jgi:hypothetical protein
MRRFYYLLPDDQLGRGPIEAKDEASARAWIKLFHALDPLPESTQVWERAPLEESALMDNYDEYQKGLPAWARGPL